MRNVDSDLGKACEIIRQNFGQQKNVEVISDQLIGTLWGKC